MKIKGRIRLCDLRPISQQEFDTAVRICEQIRKIQESRASYIEEHNIDPDIALPQANWGEGSRNDFFDAYRFVVTTPSYDVINKLRFYGQAFTGYQLMSLSGAYGKKSVNPIPHNLDEILDKVAPVPDDWVYRYVKMIRKVPEDIIVRVPKILGEIGWEVDGITVNHDVCVYQERLNLLYDAGIIDELRQRTKINGNANILEIGGGYGGLAYFIKQVIPQVNYFICDLPESLLFSSLYLGITCSESGHTIYAGRGSQILVKADLGFKYIPNFLFDDLVGTKIKIDLAINTLSFSEMSEKQVRYYARHLKDLLGYAGILFEQNHDNRSEGLIDCKRYLPDYFTVRKVIRPKSVPGLTQGVADVWSNREGELRLLRVQLQHAQAAIAAMKAGKLWRRARILWVRFKKALGLLADH